MASLIRVDQSVRPSMRDLNKHVVPLVSVKWYDLGLELLDPEHETRLATIERDNQSDARCCCRKMLSEWLETAEAATWDKLIEAVKVINMNDVARKIESLSLRDSHRTPVGVPTVSSANFEPTRELMTSHSGRINFTKYEDVSLAFVALKSKLQVEIQHSYFPIIKGQCLGRARPVLKLAVEKTSNINSLFELLDKNTIYFNWMNIKFLETIATAVTAASGNSNLEMIIEDYKDAVYSRTLSQVWNDIPSYQKVRSKYYSKLQTVFEDKDPNNVTVKEVLTNCEPSLVKGIALDILEIGEGSLKISWLISTNQVYEAFLSLSTVPQELRNDDFLQVGAWVVHQPQTTLSNLREIYGMISTSSLLIGYYHGLLMRCIDVDLVRSKMWSSGLLSAHADDYISNCYSMHQKKCLLLEEVRHMNDNNVSAFCKLVEESCPYIGSQLTIALQGDVPVHADTADRLLCNDLITTVSSSHQHLYMTSSVHIIFSHIVDQIGDLLQQTDYQQLLKQCRDMKASDVHSINLFSADRIEKSSNILFLLWTQCPYITWSDHSILRELSTHCSKAVKLLDDYESNLDYLGSVASYPIPNFSSGMIPSDNGSTHTVLAIRCDQELYNCTLQYVYDMRSLLVEKCGITLHCLQLLAVRSDPTLIYWTIPKCVVELISDQVSVHSEYLYSRGVLEALIYPDIVLATSDGDSIGSLAFVIVDEDMSEKNLIVHLDVKKAKLQERLGLNPMDAKNASTENTAVKDRLVLFDGTNTNIEKIHCLGAGTFGETNLTTFGNMLYIRKLLHKNLLDPNQSLPKLVAYFKEKCAMCFELHCPNLAKFFDIFEVDNHIAVVMEFIQVNLFTYIEQKGKNLSWDNQISLCFDMSQGLEALHRHSLVHGYLHDHNVLVQGEQAKISDFYYPLLEKYCSQDISFVRREYLAPEFVRDQSSPSFKSDIFSLGALLLQVVTSSAPLENSKQTLANVSQDHAFFWLIQQCLSKDDEKRPSARIICEKFLKQLNNSQYSNYRLSIQVEEKRKLQEAGKTGDLNMLQDLYSRGIDVTTVVNDAGCTALHEAALNGHHSVVLFLLERGAAVNVITKWGKATPLHYAAANGHTHVVATLIKHGADVSIKDRFGRNPLIDAMMNNHSDTVKYIKNIGTLYDEEWVTLFNPKEMKTMKQEIALYKLKFNQMESEIQNLSMVIQDLKGQQHSQQLVEVSHDKLMERQPEVAKIEINKLSLESSQLNDSLKSTTKQLKIMNHLGTGRYGITKRTIFENTISATKFFHKKILDFNCSVTKLVADFQKQCTPCFNIEHDNLVKLVSITEFDATSAIVTELAQMNLLDYLAENDGKLLLEKQVSLCLDMSQGMETLHRHSLIHGNLHDGNILIQGDKAKISDFYYPLLESISLEDHSRANPYMAPEIVENLLMQSLNSDVFSLGVLMLQVVTGETPMKNSNYKQMLAVVPHNHILLPLIQRCLNTNIEGRPSAGEMCEEIRRIQQTCQLSTIIHRNAIPFFQALQDGRYNLNWIECKPLPAPVWKATAVTLNNVIYVCGGESPNELALYNVFAYDIDQVLENSWDQLPPLSHSHGIPVVVDGLLVVIGGKHSSGRATNQVSTYNRNMRKWESLYPNLTEERYEHFALVYKHFVIVGGGKYHMIFDILYDDFEILNFKDSNNLLEWRKVNTKLPSKMCSISATIWYDQLWIVSYTNSYNRQAKEMYCIQADDIVSDKNGKGWISVSRSSPYYGCAVVSNCFPIIAVGGCASDTRAVNHLVMYDSSNNSWNVIASLSGPPRAFTTVINLKEVVVVLGGCTATRNRKVCNDSSLTLVQIGYAT